jgi:hypothetical protein
MVARRGWELALFLDVSEMNGDTGDKINSCPFYLSADAKTVHLKDVFSFLCDYT